MTVQITEADKRFTDMSGKVYAGMTADDAKKENVESLFNRVNKDKDDILSYEEMFEDLQEDRELMKTSQKQGFGFGIASVILGVLSYKISKRTLSLNNLICLGCACYNLYELACSKMQIAKIDKKHKEWTKLYSEMEAKQPA